MLAKKKKFIFKKEKKSDKPEFLFFKQSLVSDPLFLKGSEILLNLGLQHTQHFHLQYVSIYRIIVQYCL
jgi:hypothetical protein